MDFIPRNMQKSIPPCESIFKLPGSLAGENLIYGRSFRELFAVDGFVRSLSQIARGDLENVIGRGIGADVAQSVKFIGCFEDDTAGGDDIGLVALQCLKRAFFDDHQLFGGVLVRRMWRFARIKRRDVALEFSECRRGRIKHRTCFADFRRLHFKVGPVEDARMHHWLSVGFRKRDARDCEGNGNGGDR